MFVTSHTGGKYLYIRAVSKKCIISKEFFKNKELNSLKTNDT